MPQTSPIDGAKFLKLYWDLPLTFSHAHVLTHALTRTRTRSTPPKYFCTKLKYDFPSPVHFPLDKLSPLIAKPWKAVSFVGSIILIFMSRTTHSMMDRYIMVTFSSLRRSSQARPRHWACIQALSLLPLSLTFSRTLTLSSPPFSLNSSSSLSHPLSPLSSQAECWFWDHTWEHTSGDFDSPHVVCKCVCVCVYRCVVRVGERERVSSERDFAKERVRERTKIMTAKEVRDSRRGSVEQIKAFQTN